MEDLLDSPDQMRSALRILGSVVAPTTLLTALLIYFGRQHTIFFFSYFGIDFSLLGFTTQDFVATSVDILLVPLAVGLSVGLAALWIHAWLTPRLLGDADPKRVRRLAAVVAVPGAFLFVAGMIGLLDEDVRGNYNYFYPFSLAAGTLLLLAASRLQRRSRRTRAARGTLSSIGLVEATGAFLLVALTLFWAESNYASDKATLRAQRLEQSLTRELPRAVVYSKDRLHLESAGVRETRCADADSGYRFRYDGLLLVLRSAGQYFLLPDTWSRSNGMALVVPEGDSVRLQLSPPGRRRVSPPADASIIC